jgi:mxaK protein
MIKAIRHYTVWGALMITLAVALQSAFSCYQISNVNQLISRLNQGKGIKLEESKDVVPELQLARATYLKKKHRFNEAQASLSLIINQGDKNIQAISRYNLGNTCIVSPRYTLFLKNKGQP